MATRRSSSKYEDEKSLKEKRGKQLEEIDSIVKRLQDCLEKAKAMRSRYALLSSVSHGLYEEIDKLTKKAPAEPVTDLILSQVNDVIREVKELAADDPYVQRLNEFVAAGDNPEQRDVVVVLRQLRQGLARFEDTITTRINTNTSKLNEATTIQVALRLFQEGKEDISLKNIDDFGFGHSDVWFLDDFRRPFDWNRLDRIDFKTYFPSC